MPIKATYIKRKNTDVSEFNIGDKVRFYRGVGTVSNIFKNNAGYSYNVKGIDGIEYCFVEIIGRA